MTDFSREDLKFMDMAIRQARKGLGRTRPNPAVGAVIVKNGVVVGRGFHRKAGTPHAEVNAIADAADNTKDAAIYVTLEPCNHHGRTPPCSEAIIKAGIKKVVIGALDPNPGVEGGGMQRLVNAGIECLYGCRERECMKIVAPFVKHAVTGRPWIICKTACSMDGRIATRTGHSRWITDDMARKEGHRLRNIVDAILVGRGTVDTDNPSLTCRINNGRDPARIVLDSNLLTDPDSRIYTQASNALSMVACLDTLPEEKVKPFAAKNVKILRLPDDGTGRIDVASLLERTGAIGIQSILVEGGGEVHGTFRDMGLIDEVRFFYAPKIIGGRDAMPAIGGTGSALVSDAVELQEIKHKKIGDNWLVSGVVVDHLSVLWSR